MNRPKPGIVEERTAPDATVDGKRLRGLIPYGVESRDMGGWREVIEPGALAGAELGDLVATVDHLGIPIGRYPTTLDLEDRSDGAHWSVQLPESRSDVREAVERGDLKAGSWRMVVAGDEWRGEVRHVKQISQLLDVAVVTAPAYPAASTEYRSTDPGIAQEDTMGNEPENSNTETTITEAPEDRAVPAGLQVEDRVAATPARRRGLADEFRAAGFPGEMASIPWEAFEERAITWTGSVDNINKMRRGAVDLGYDQRYVWPVVGQIPVGYEVTSVDVLTQTARSLATAANVIRAVDAVSVKPETGSTLAIVTTALKQVATIQTNVPNVYLEQQAFNTIIENDLRLAINDALDKLVIDGTVASGFEAPGTNNALVSYRKAMTTLFAAGYNPDTLVLTPAAAEALDVMVSGISGGSADFVFAPAQFAPDAIFKLNRRISKSAAAPIVMDSQAFGKLYASPVTLARFEADSGTTNRSNVRMELNAVFGVERQTAAIRVAAA